MPCACSWRCSRQPRTLPSIGLACRLLSPDERGVGNGIQIAGGLLGNMLGGGAVLLAYPHLGWHGSVMTCRGYLAYP